MAPDAATNPRPVACDAGDMKSGVPGVGYLINTFASGADAGRRSIPWLRDISRLLEQLVEELRRLTAPRDGPTTDFGLPGDLYRELTVETIDGSVEELDPNVGWPDLFEMFEEGRALNGSFSTTVLDSAGSPHRSDFTFEVDISLDGLLFEEVAHTFSFGVSRALFDRTADKNEAFESDFIASAIDLAERVEAVTGYVTAAWSDPFDSSYELLLQEQLLLSSGEGRSVCDRWLRGVHWGNFLTERHLEKVGDVEMLRTRLPRGSSLRHLTEGLLYVQFPGTVRAPEGIPADPLSSPLGPAVMPADLRVRRGL